ncbi:MAG: ABC transporter ATP-binding protein [Acidobacteria bacterium]|nr:ABC transporter ATP-binding protein [Acidobacteriota bacterium]
MSEGFHEEEVLGKAYDSRLMKRLLRYLRPYRGAVVLAVALIISYSILQVAVPLFFKVAVDRYLSGADAVPEAPLLAGKLATVMRQLPADPLLGLNWLAVVLLVVLAGAFLIQYAQVFLMQMTGQRVMYDLRMQIFGHLQRLPIAFYDRNPVGRLVTRVTTDVDVLNEMFTSGVVAIFGDFFTLLGIVAVMLYLNWKLALLTFSVLPFILLVTLVFRKLVRDCYRRIRIAVARINAFLNEHLTGMSVVQLFNRERRASSQFDRVNRDHMLAFKDAILAHAWFYPAVEILSAIAIALTIWFGGLQVLEGVARGVSASATAGTLVAFILYAQRFFRPIMDLSEKYNILQSAMASAERIFKLLDAEITITSPAQPTRIPSAQGRVEFRNLWFAYRDEEWVLQDINFVIEPGEMVAIVGHTGAGKTTLTNLLLRFYDVRRGQIVLDGEDIRNLDLHALRQNFGIVLQDPFLFSGTLASNVRLGTDRMPDEAVERALAHVNLHGFVASLPDGLKHEVRERGATLSVGQKQLISFARALAHDPQILILDEATSSVDTQTEFQIRAALERLVEGRTSIVIAHRLSTVQRADKILVLHKGRLREMGTHQELLAQRGIYYKLYQLQYRDQELAVADD